MFSRIYTATVLAKPRLVLALLALVLFAFSLAIPRIAFDASSDSIVLEGDQDLRYSQEVSSRYGSSEFLVVAYTPNQPLFTPAGLSALERLQADFEAMPTTASVNSILDVPLLYSPKVGLAEISEGFKTLRGGDVDLALAKQEFANSPVYKNLLTNQEGTTTALQILIKEDETYNRLRIRRDNLRHKARQEGLSDTEVTELDQVTAEFEAYKLVAAAQQEQMIVEARQILANHQAQGELFLGGVPMIAVDMVNFIKGDLKTLGLGGVIVIVALMVFFFRSLRWVAIPLITVVVTIAIMLGFLGAIDWRMTVISSNFVAILLVINLSILIHLVVRYRELAVEFPQDEVPSLVLKTVSFMAKPCIYTTLTTLVAFASLVISGIRPVIDFGYMMSIGVVLALVNSFLVLPCVLLILPREFVSESAEAKPVTLLFAAAVEKFGALVITGVVALTGISLYGVSQLEVETRFIDYFHSDTEIYQGMKKIDEELGGTIPLEIVLTAEQTTTEPEIELTEAQAAAPLDDDVFGDDGFADDDPFSDAVFDDEFASDSFDDGFGGDAFADDAFGEEAANTSVGGWFTRSGLERIKSVHDYLDAKPELGKVLSLATLYEVVGDLAGKDVDDIQLALAKRSMPDVVDDVLIAPYYDESRQEVRISVRAMETSESLKRDELLKTIQHDLVNELGFKEENVRLTGMLVLYNNMLQSLYSSQILTLGAVFIAIMVMFFILFGSLKLSIIAIFPNLLAAAIVLGGMGLSGIPLDLMTITIAAICIGIGVDDTVHYIYRFKEEFAIDGNYHNAMFRSHASIGKAMYYTSVIIVVGFGVLALSNFKPTIYFGLLTGAGMIAALLGALLVLPKLIVMVKPFGAERV